jgi:hypothetical protein
VIHSSFVYLFIYSENMFDLRYMTSGRQPTAKQLDKLRQEEINRGPNLLTWFKEQVNHDLFVIYIILLCYL